MRIPLDYYQILGVPESNLSELEQAYQDRLLQLPRQEYSETAIESRKQLIAVAYQILSDPLQRAQYEATHVSYTIDDSDCTLEQASEAATAFQSRPELDIAPEHFLGGLLILFERGEYEEINSICMPYLGNNGRSSNSGNLHPHSTSVNSHQELAPDPNSLSIATLAQTANSNQLAVLKPDIVLAMVSSFWELGEREWRDGCHEEAVIHYETAKQILRQEDLFPQIQGELDRRIDRLRPYLIASLVSLPLDRHEQRQQGINFLEELLESACTNEVKCQERFALNSESTIPFIHENLPYLTAAEQRNLFSQLARNSHQLGSEALNVMQLACTYLHIHALIAQGFAYHNPQLIYTAQQILHYRLSQRIDVTIEQAICALLLGQTEQADRILSTATESAALVVIRQQSQGLPNLLRGLCWYIESWLKDEAFPCFRDLVTSDPSLDAYFNDRDVQEFADRLPTADLNVASWAASSPQLIEVPPSGDLSGSIDVTQSDLPLEDTAAVTSGANVRRPNSLNTVPSVDRLGTGIVTPAVRVEQSPPPIPPEPLSPEEPDNNIIQLEHERQRRRSLPTARTIEGELEQTYPAEQIQSAIAPDPSSQLVTPTTSGRLVATNATSAIVRPRRTRRKPHIPRILLVVAGGGSCLWGIGWAVNETIQNFTPAESTIAPVASTSSPRSIQTPSAVESLPTTTKPKPVLVSSLTTDTAQKIVEKWLSTKTKSLSKEYQIAQLKEVLVEPALSSTLERAQTAKAEGIHWQYEHRNIGVSSISQANPQASSATIQARVTEDAKYYQGGRFNPDRSYSKQLLVQYALVRQKDGWYIKDMDVIKSLN